MKTPFYQFTRVWVITLFFALVIAPSCARNKAIESSLFKDERFEIALVNEQTPGGLNVKHGFNHPVKISVSTMAEMLRGLRYKDPVFLWKEKDRAIFSDEEIAKLTPLFAEAFGKLTPDQMIRFDVKTYKKDHVFGGDKYTSGFTFINDQGINWAFGNINISLSQKQEIYTGNPLNTPPKGIVVALNDQQKHHQPPNPSWYEPKTFHNWLIEKPPFDLEQARLPVPETPEPQTQDAAAIPVASSNDPKAKSPQMASPQIQQSDPTERLRLLKQLHDENLISDQDYQKKKAEILNNL